MLLPYGSECWICGAKHWVQAVHVLPEDDKGRKTFENLGLLNFRVSSHTMNSVLLCSLCHAAFDDLFNPGVVFFPQYLDYFIKYERIDRPRRLLQGGPREVPTAEMYLKHSMYRRGKNNNNDNNNIPSEEEEEEEGAQPQGGPYSRYLLLDYLRDDIDFEPVRSWHGAPLASLRRAWAAIGTINDAAIPRETRQKLLELLELYREPLRPETETHDDGKGKDRAPPGGGAGKGDGDDDGEDGGEGRTEQRKKRKGKEPAESSAKKKPRRSERINKPVVKAAEHSKGKHSADEKVEDWLDNVDLFDQILSTVQSVQGQEVC